MIAASTPGRACATAAAALLAGAAAAGPDWPVAGAQGLVRFVIVPEAEARDREAYARAIASLCEPGATCFLNFYTNSRGAAVALPLPDAIEREPAAIYRRSAKQGAERFQWSCRLQQGGDPCF